MTKNWQSFYEVHVTRANSAERFVPFTSSNSLDALDYAYNKIAHNDAAFDRIEVRDYWGDTVVQTVWMSSRVIRNIDERINKMRELAI